MIVRGYLQAGTVSPETFHEEENTERGLGQGG
jgi:hypothetical protein